jgi:hypothetical protein
VATMRAMDEIEREDVWLLGGDDEEEAEADA